jgi:hypothetical protein
MLEVVFHLAAPLTDTEPSFTFIQGIEGEIRDDESEVVIGQISASLVQVGRVAGAGENLFDPSNLTIRESNSIYVTAFGGNARMPYK